MKNKLSKYNTEFFLSYQFLEDKEPIFKCLDSIKDVSIKNNEFRDIDYYIDKLDSIFREEIYISLRGKKEIGVFLSGGRDSFSLLYYIRNVFPEIKIYTFTFFPRKPLKNELEELKKLSKKLNTIHTNYYQNISFVDIINELKFIYLNLKKPLGDEGLLYSSFLIRKIKKTFNIKNFITGDGIDILFGGMPMYRLSYLESLFSNGSTIEDNLFVDKYEKDYFYNNIKNYENNFFYKYGEYFGGDFLGANFENIRNKFFSYYNMIGETEDKLKREIIFNYIFLVSSRGIPFIKESSKINNTNIISPFFGLPFVKKILNLNIPSEFLLNKKDTKIIIRRLADKINKDNNINFTFLDTLSIDFYKNFNLGSKYIILVGKFLLDNGYITEKHFKNIPYFIENSMWYENKIRVYLLLNLYFFIKYYK